MSQTMTTVADRDQKLFHSLLAEVNFLQERLDALEREPTSMEDVMALIGGIQRDIVQLYRASRA